MSQTRQYWASAKSNGDFICVETYSGLGLTGRDPAGNQHLLQLDVGDDVLGSSIIDALKRSRVLTREEYGVFFDYKKISEQHAFWIKALMDRYGYRTKRALFKNMKSCGILAEGDVIIISPSRHEKLEAWGREKGDGIEDVVIEANRSPSEIGAALRLAFSRCTE